METVVRILDMLRAVAQKVGPYLMLEILLPGGTLLALLLFLYRRGLPFRRSRANDRQRRRPRAEALERSPPELVHP
jgi:hypothetical protein